MNPSPRWPLMVVALCAAGVLAALAWATVNVLGLEARERQAQADAAFEQSVRLALWRIDSALTPLIAREATRPYFHYQPFFPADRAYAAMLDETLPDQPLVESPLLRAATPFVRLHFQHAGDGKLMSPEVPTGNLRVLAQTASVPEERLTSARAQLDRLALILSAGSDDTPAPDAITHLGTGADGQNPVAERPQGQPGDAVFQRQDPAQTVNVQSEFAARQKALQGAVAPATQIAQEQTRNTPRVPASLPTVPGPAGGEPLRDSESLGDSARVDGKLALKERHQSSPASVSGGGERSNRVAGGAGVEKKADPPQVSAPRGESESGLPKSDSEERDATGLGGVKRKSDELDSALRRAAPDGDGGKAELSAAAAPSVVEVGEFVPRWCVGAHENGPQLILVRAVSSKDVRFTQGCWFDWPALRRSLLDEVRDLLPGAMVTPIAGASGQDSGSQSLARRLAAIPAQIDPGPAPIAPVPRWTPMRSAIVLTWATVLAALIGLASLVRTARDLAERRGRFVSAVTHELRTPLTTFVLYSQMLADGVVREEAARAEYLATLKGESARLARIVENVLDFARVGRRHRPANAPTCAVSTMLATIGPELVRRAQSDGLCLNIRDETTDGDRVRIDPTSLGRALFNLVDNACKYAPSREGALDSDLGSQPLELRVVADRHEVAFSVSDRGPGIDPRDQRRLFKPFQRGHRLEHAAKSGLGLGLSLSRELARHAGGDVRLERTSREGTTFVLILPLARG